ncbi:MAG: thiamine phosphate synthase [Bacteroidales bacterium]
MTIPRLYVIVDDEAAAARGWTLGSLAAAYLEGGARLLQLRAKRLSSRELLARAEELSTGARPCEAGVIVNDRADVARLVRGAGVHVGQDDLPPARVREVVGADRVVGFSTHTPAQIDAALVEPISYLAVGPVFPTLTKATGYDQVGLDLVRYAVAAAHAHAERTGASLIPVVAIGGITLDTARSVLDAGAASVAVISDLLVGNSPADRVRAFLDRLA